MPEPGDIGRPIESSEPKTASSLVIQRVDLPVYQAVAQSLSGQSQILKMNFGHFDIGVSLNQKTDKNQPLGPEHVRIDLRIPEEEAEFFGELVGEALNKRDEVVEKYGKYPELMERALKPNIETAVTTACSKRAITRIQVETHQKQVEIVEKLRVDVAEIMRRGLGKIRKAT